MSSADIPEVSQVVKTKIVLLAGAGLCFFFSFFKIFDQDTWYHLAGGRLIARSGLVGTNTFSNLFTDHPWKNTEWLFDLLLYRSFEVGGIPALQVLQIVLVIVIFTFVLRTALQKVGDIDLYELSGLIVLLLLALSVSRFRFPLRPHLITYMGMAAVIFLRVRKPGLRLFWLALVAIFWANCHAGVIFGLGLCVMFFLTSILQRDPVGTRTAGREIAVFFTASLLNPFHIYPYLFSFQHLNLGKDLPTVSEFRVFSPSMHGWTFPILIGLFLVAVPAAIRRRDYFIPMAGMVFLVLSLFAVREIPAFVVVVLPGLVAASSDLHRSLARQKEGSKIYVLIVLLVVTMAALQVPSDWRRYGAHLRFGSGVNSTLLPENAAEFVRTRRLTGRMYNDYSQGGYLIWKLYPDYGVFQDGRATAYPPEFLQEVLGTRVTLTPVRWLTLMGKYDCRFAIVRRNPFSGDPGVAALFESLDWPLVFLDGAALVYVRPGSENVLRTEDHTFELIRATADAKSLFLKGRQDPLGMVRELSQIDMDSLVIPYDAFRFAAAALGAGQSSLMEKILARMWRMEGGDYDPEMVGHLLGQMQGEIK